MNRVTSAIESGRCVLAVSGALLRDPNVMFELSRRDALPSVALAGAAVAPVQAVSPAALARATGQAAGVIVLVEPETADQAGLQAIANAIGGSMHKPQLLVVARNFNPLQFAMLFRGLSVGHIKGRGKEFVRDLPMPPVLEAPAPAAAEKAKAAEPAPAGPVFVGREEELAQLQGLLAEGGPIVVSGPAGVGRSTLVEAAIDAAGLTRLPELVLGRGTGADALLGRLAAITSAGGSEILSDTLKRVHTPAEAARAAVEALQAASGTEGQAFVVHELHRSAGRDGDFFNKSRLEMVVIALLTARYPLRIVFTSRVQPVFYREGEAASLRRMELSGIKGRFYHDIFQAVGAPEFAREKYGPLSERLHGSPFMVRLCALAVRDREDGLALLDNPKFMAMESLDDTKAVEKSVSKRLEKLQGPLREALAVLAHLRLAAPGNLISELGISKKVRAELLATGLLDQIVTRDRRLFRVHPLIARGLDLREVSDFEVNARVGDALARLAKDASGVEQLALQQEANRCWIGARRLQGLFEPAWHDQDAVVDSAYGLIRGQKPHFGMARQRLDEVLRRNPADAEAWAARIELADRDDQSPTDVSELIERALAAAPCPELVHKAVDLWSKRRNRIKAIEILERAVEALPEEPRLRTRLGALLLADGRRPDAVRHLQAAMEMAPMLPDAYGLLGMARRDEPGTAQMEAENLLREAVRLAPSDPVQVSRLCGLLLEQARAVDGAPREALYDEAIKLLDEVIRGERRTPDSYLLMAQVLRERGDLDRAAWMLKQARKDLPKEKDRAGRLPLEYALLDIAQGKLDEAERTLRGMGKGNPSDHRVCAALSKLLEARQQWIPAHAEMQRAKDRAPMHSWQARAYDAELVRLRALIEAQASAVGHGLSIDAVVGPAEGSEERRVIRRRGAAAEDAAVEAEDAAVEAEEPAVEAAPEAPEATPEA